MKNLLYLVLVSIASTLSAQDYIMYETHYLSPKPGHNAELMKEIAEHNKKYHAAGPYTNVVYSVVNGPRTGQLFFAMGPLSFTHLDSRPNSPEHNEDWDSVVKHSGTVQNAEYWVRNDELSFLPENSPYSGAKLSRVRFFEVADNSDFVALQKKIGKTIQKMNNKRPRVMYDKRFAHKDGRDWAVVRPYTNWAELDEDNDGPTFKETFMSIYGESSWEQFSADWDKTVLSIEDEWRMLVDPMPAEVVKN